MRSRQAAGGRDPDDEREHERHVFAYADTLCVAGFDCERCPYRTTCV